MAACVNEELNTSFYCPITQDLMDDPVVDSEGNSFERSAITEWLARRGESPLTRTPMTAEQLRPNRAVKDAIDEARGHVPSNNGRAPLNPYAEIAPEDAGAVLYEMVKAKKFHNVQQMCDHFRGNATVLEYHEKTARWTPMHRASEDNSIDIVTCLLDAGAQVDSNNSYGRTPLHFAAWTREPSGHPGYTVLARLLLRRGANIQHTDNAGWSPLHRAVNENRAGVVSCLLNAGALVDARDSAGRTPLHFAASKGYTEFARLLLCRGADIQVEDYSGWSPLHRAVQEDKREAVPLLMQRGASLTVTGNDGKTPSDLIVSEEMRVLFCTREDAGAALYDRVAAKDMLGVSSICNRFCGDVSVLNHPNSSQHDYAPLHKAIIDSGGRPEIAACLLDAGAHVDAKERGGWTALHHASNRDFLDIVLLLLSRGASTTSRSAIGQSPVHVAKTEAMKMLFNNHADGGNYGYMSGPWITGRRPVQSVQVLSGSDIVYMIKDDGYVKMVTSNGVAKYYTGELADFDPNKWNQYNDAGRNYRHEPA